MKPRDHLQTYEYEEIRSEHFSTLPLIGLFLSLFGLALISGLTVFFIEYGIPFLRSLV